MYDPENEHASGDHAPFSAPRDAGSAARDAENEQAAGRRGFSASVVADRATLGAEKG